MSNKRPLTVFIISILLIAIIWEADKSSVVRFDWRDLHEVMPLAALLLWGVLFAALVYGLSLIGHKVLKAQLAHTRQVTGEQPPADSTRSEVDEVLMLLLSAVTAITAGDMATARESLAKLRKKTGNNPLLDVLMLKVYKGEKDYDRMAKLSAKLSKNPELELAGLKAAVEAETGKKEFDKALATANKAFDLRPDLYWVIEHAFNLRARADDWAGALQVLNAAAKNKLIAPEKLNELKATTHYQMALKAKEKGDSFEFFWSCRQAVAASRTLVPAALALAQYYVEHDNQIRAASQVLKNAWRCNPTSEIAEAYLDLHPHDTPVQRLQRMERLAHYNHIRPSLNNLLLADLCIKAELWGKAKSEFEIFLINNPATKRLAHLIAEYEAKANNNKQAAEVWRQKAADCPADASWVCEECRHISTKWLPICKKCGAVGRYGWRLYKRQK